MSWSTLRTALARFLPFSRYKVGGNSMLPTLSNGQYVLAAHRGELRRGQIVVLRNPVLIDRVFIKRIIGLPDECIRLEGDSVFINDSLLEETYLGVSDYCYEGGSKEWWLGPGEYFVLSDNRSEGLDDSRAFGYVNRELILARAWLRYWPPHAWGKID